MTLFKVKQKLELSKLYIYMEFRLQLCSSAACTGWKLCASPSMCCLKFPMYTAFVCVGACMKAP